ncbi:MAG: LysE family translocator [Bacteroidales bacterium]|nr:LysE family translocator [Bacteroidales bacterium]
MLLNLLKSFLIGICASVPLGPVAILVIQKTFSIGHRAGFITGLGATLTDTLYSALAIFALSFAQSFLGQYKVYVYLIGGVIVGIIGWFMLRSNPFRRLKDEEDESHHVRNFLQASVMGLSNPGAILIIFGLFAFFGMGEAIEHAGWRLVPLICAVCAGSVCYWYSMSLLLSRFRKRIKLRTILWINRITGVIVMGIGLFLIGSGLQILLTK